MKRGKKDKGRFNKLYGIGIAILCVIIVFISMILLYFKKFDRTLAEENEVHLAETASQIAAHTLSIVESTKTNLCLTAAAIESIGDREEMGRYLANVEKTMGFSYMGYAGMDGKLYVTVNMPAEDITEENYFEEALQGKTVITGLRRKIMQDKAVTGILIATPINDASNRPMGVLIAMMDIKRLQDVLRVSSFNGNGYAYLIDSEGELVLRTRSMDYNNFFMVLQNVEFIEGSYRQVREDAAAQREGIVQYDNMGTRQYAYYCPLGLNDWTVVNIVAREVVAANTAKLTKELAFLCVVSIVVFIILLVTAVLTFSVSENQKRATEMKTVFFANISHELRTPMNAIVGVSELLRRGSLNMEQKEYVEIIINSGKSLLAIINDILDFSKMESGKFTLVEDKYSVKMLLADVTTIAVIRIGDKPILFYADVEGDTPEYLYGDVTRVKQILINLLGNAVKFTEKGLIRLTVKCRRENEKFRMEISVSDTGIGIRKQDMDQLFISFNRVDTHRNYSVEGTGLGLSITKQLVKMMDGDIGVESIYEEGSTFTAVIYQKAAGDERLIKEFNTAGVRIALCEPQAQLRSYYEAVMNRMGLTYDFYRGTDELREAVIRDKPSHVAADSDTLSELKELEAQVHFAPVVLRHQNTQQFGAARGTATVYAPLFCIEIAALFNRNEDQYGAVSAKQFDPDALCAYPEARILVVDDNDLNLEITAALMAPYKMKVVCAASGREAVEEVKGTPYDLIFMDHMMPEMDGVETLKCIRAMPERRDVPVIVLTANATKDAQAMFLEEGFDDFLAKPLEPDRLDAILHKWLVQVQEKKE